MLIWALCFGAAVVVCCSFASRLGQWLDVIDHPDGLRKRHARPTPLVGGIALMVPLLLVAGFQAWVRPTADGIFTVLIVAGLGFMLLGLFDDRHQATPNLRLLISIVLCSLLLALEPGLRLERLDLGPLAIPLSVFALPFTVLCLVGLQNAINMADGLNGLVIGLAIFWTICLLLYAPPALMLYLSLLLMGLLILLAYNLSGRLFLGDAGSYSLGVSIGLLMLYVHHQAGGRLPMLTVMLWLLVPVLDCLRVMVARILANRSPVTADTNHLHHRLARCWPWPVSVLVYLALASLPGLIAAVWLEQTEVMLLATLAAYSGVIWVTREGGLATERKLSAL
jgi:UDP-GlcNAc:undecaprenyl-phosphate/decaprenyl-phosphate GlcNAc-1-phosphate transferase